MFIPTSSEFVALCQSQVAVLTQGLGAALSAVYLTTEELVEGTQPKLIPIVVYPDAGEVWQEDNRNLGLPDPMAQMANIPRLSTATPRLLPQTFDNPQQEGSTSADWEDHTFPQQRQIVLPLIHEGVVMGLLVTSREDRPWNEREQATIKRIARTLTIAYLMDQRRLWSEQQLTRTRRLHAQEQDLLHDLLHQIRNPLTALRTFGKLLLKRLLLGDRNRDVASSIIRESDRLQELLEQFDECLDIYAEQTTPLILPPSPFTESDPLQIDIDPNHHLLNNPPETDITSVPLPPSKLLTLESFSVTEVLEPLLSSAQAIAQERELDLQVSLPTPLPFVQGNRKALREVLTNLIDNALKYTPAGGQIHIQVGIGQPTACVEAGGQNEIRSDSVAGVSPLLKNRVGIAISDTGPGIPPQDVEHLFERHYRGVQAATAIPGTGLGLAIAKELIEQMQGEIQVFSPAQSPWAKQNLEFIQGTTFVVWLVLSDESVGL